MRKVGAILTVVLLCVNVANASDIPRDGNLKVPSKEEAIQICKRNQFIDNNMLLASCVRMEQQSARRIIDMMSSDRDAASEAYWNCVKNQFIDNFSLLASCMDQEREAAKFLKQ